MFVVALAALPRQFVAPIDVYDEGLLLTHADHVRAGLEPYRDFYTNYPPGVPWLVALAWRVAGPSVLLERGLGLALGVLVAFLAARLAARAAGATRGLSWPAFGAICLWLRHGPAWPTAWLAALACALLAVDLAVRAGTSTKRWFAVGLAFGAVACLRHDLCVYASVGFLGVFVLARVVRARFQYPPGRAIAALVVGTSLLPCATYGWIFAHAGFRQPFLDLYYDQVHSMLPGRVLPLPRLWEFDRLALGVWIGFVAPVAWLVGLARGRRSLAWIALGVLAIAGLPQMTNRADTHHVVYGLAPGLAILAVTLAELTWRSRVVQGLASAGLCVLLAGGALGLRLKPGRDWTPLSIARAGPSRARDAGLAQARERIAAFVAEHTRADERIFVGNRQHARVFVSEMDLYFLCDRRGAVRRMQFDPNLTNRPDEQALMIAEIERCGARVAVLAPDLDPHEPNDSSKYGSTLLDDWLARHFVLAEEAGPYQLLLRVR